MKNNKKKRGKNFPITFNYQIAYFFLANLRTITNGINTIVTKRISNPGVEIVVVETVV